jgi:WD40 repeat protein
MRSDDANAIYALALAQRERGNLKTAIEETARAIEIEPREEYRRAFVAIEKIITRTARCVERVQVAQGFEGRICVDGRGEFILVERLVTDLGDGIDGEGKIFEVIKTATGQVLHKFTQQIVEGETQKVSLSEDLLWELIDETNNEGERVSALLRRVGAKTSEARFRLIAWSNNLSATLSASEIIAGKIYSGRVNGNKVDIIDNANGNEIGGLIGHEGAVTALSFSENGKFVLTGGADRTLRLWELPVLRCLRTFTAIGGAALAVYLDVNGKFALSLESGGLVRIWDVSILCSGNLFRAPLLLSHVTSSEEAGRRQSEMNNYYVNIKESIRKSDYAAAISFISAASLLSGWETMRMRLGVEGVWNSIAKHARRKSLSATICSSILKGHHDVISTVAISANGKLAASAGKDTGIRVWNIAGQKCVCELAGHSDWVRSIGLTRDGRFLFSGSWDGTVRVWNIATGKCVRTTEERIKSITKIAVNPQSRTVAIATAQGRVILWDVLTNKVKGVLAAGTSAVNAIKYSGNGEYLVTGSEDGNVLLWRLGSDIPERVLGVHKTAVTDVEIAADLSRVISADRDGKVLICNFSGGVQEGEVRGHLSEITGLVFLPDSRFFMSCSKDAKVRINSVDGNNSLSNEVEHLSPVLAISIDQYGNHFVTGSDDAVLRVWSLYWNYELTE